MARKEIKIFRWTLQLEKIKLKKVTVILSYLSKRVCVRELDKVQKVNFLLWWVTQITYNYDVFYGGDKGVVMLTT